MCMSSSQLKAYSSSELKSIHILVTFIRHHAAAHFNIHNFWVQHCDPIKAKLIHHIDIHCSWIECWIEKFTKTGRSLRLIEICHKSVTDAELLTSIDLRARKNSLQQHMFWQWFPVERSVCLRAAFGDSSSKYKRLARITHAEKSSSMSSDRHLPESQADSHFSIRISTLNKQHGSYCIQMLLFQCVYIVQWNECAAALIKLTCTHTPRIWSVLELGSKYICSQNSHSIAP